MPLAAHSVFLLTLAVLLGACSGTPHRAVRMHSLDTPAAVDPLPGTARYDVILAPVTVPDEVDRPQIVVSAGPRRVRALEGDHWARPLRPAITQLLASELGRHLPAARVSSPGAQAGDGSAVLVVVNVRAFESAPGVAVLLDAAWEVQSGSAWQSGRSRIREPVAGPGIEPLVRAHGRAIAELADSLAAAIRPLAPQGQ